MQLSRLSDGKRQVTSVAEITGMEGDIIQMQEIYKYVRTGTAADGTVQGHFLATGVRPRFLSHLIKRGIKIPGSYFDPSKPLYLIQVLTFFFFFFYVFPSSISTRSISSIC